MAKKNKKDLNKENALLNENDALQKIWILKLIQNL